METANSRLNSASWREVYGSKSMRYRSIDGNNRSEYGFLGPRAEILRESKRSPCDKKPDRRICRSQLLHKYKGASTGQIVYGFQKPSFYAKTGLRCFEKREEFSGFGGFSGYNKVVSNRWWFDAGKFNHDCAKLNR